MTAPLHDYGIALALAYLNAGATAVQDAQGWTQLMLLRPVRVLHLRPDRWRMVQAARMARRDAILAACPPRTTPA